MASLSFNDIRVGEQVKGSRTISWNETGDSIMQVDAFNSQANNFFSYYGSLEQTSRGSDYVMALRGYGNDNYAINGIVEFYIPSGAMNVSLYFNYGVDSESNYDWFTVNVNSAQMARISGSETGFVSTGLGSGMWHNISLGYSKDGSQSGSYDMGWIDDLQVSYIMPSPSNRFDLQYSTDGSTWNAIASTSGSSYTWDTTQVVSSTTMRLRLLGYSGSSLQTSVISPIFSVLNVKSPVFATPTAGATVRGSYNITWTRPSGTHVSTPYEIQISLDNGASWARITNTYTSNDVLSFTYNFGLQSNTNNAKLRIRAYDSSNGYLSPWTTSSTFIIINKVVIGVHKIKSNTSTIELPIYDPLVGMDSKNQFRFKLANGNIGCYELVDITDALASPLRIKTPTAIKSIAKR